MTQPLMEYTNLKTIAETSPEVTLPPPLSGADKYHGEIAAGYDAKRENTEKWKTEQTVIENMLDDLQTGDWVLDVPCGTGRFVPYCQRRGLVYIGIDKSEEMIMQAAQKVTDPQHVRFGLGDVRALPRKDKSIDATLMVRLTRWLEPPDCVLALRELQRVSRKSIISTWRVRNHKHARSYDLINSALEGWKIHRDEEGSDPDYRIIELRPQ